MTVTMPALARPSVGTLRLRNGERAVTISAGGHRVIVRPRHLSTLLDDLAEHEEDAQQ